MAQGLPSTASLARFCQKLNRRKTLEEPTTETSLRCHLTTLELTLLGVGAPVGMGLYLLMGTVAQEMAGPAVTVSFSVAAVASLLAALCYVEFEVRVPCTGSPYLFTYVWAGFIVAAGAICAINTLLLNLFLFLSLMVHAMAADGLFFQVFACMHSRTQVPVVGILVFGVLMALLALLLDLETLVQFISIGILLECTVLPTSIIIIRFQKAPPSSSQDPGSPVGTEQASAPEVGQLRPALRPYLSFLGGSITLDCVLVFGDTALHLPPWGYTLLLVLSSATFLLSLLVLGAHQQQHRQDTFQVPMVPLTPALSILLNIFLMLHLSYLAWLYLSICLLIGLAVYFGYGIRHSKENQREWPRLTVPHGSLEEMVPALQPPSQAPAQEPDHTEQPASP
uniref:Cationic amino acid transporter C-terminal domain-containing protein n=1 Tax=Equus asinus TaxID=9793 RepID=A0A9L0IKR7_EQUAS